MLEAYRLVQVPGSTRVIIIESDQHEYNEEERAYLAQQADGMEVDDAVGAMHTTSYNSLVSPLSHLAHFVPQDVYRACSQACPLMTCRLGTATPSPPSRRRRGRSSGGGGRGDLHSRALATGGGQVGVMHPHVRCQERQYSRAPVAGAE